MSWNGTLRCSNCYEQGHNKRGCPVLKAEIAERRAVDPDDWRVKNHDRHRAYTSRKGEQRDCTYCSTTGHNRRTCGKLKAHVHAIQKASVAWRRAFLQAMQTAGLGTGSIITEDHWRQGRVRYLVTGVNWDKLSYAQRGNRPLRVRNLAQLTKGESLVALPRTEGVFDVDALRGTYTDRDIKILGAKGDISPPDGWVEEGMSAKEAKQELKERRSWNFEESYPNAISHL
tara:strand:- start:938 stop:1624 length:687 start_codon:yes stop_codon:yes gene_type:complete